MAKLKGKGISTWNWGMIGVLVAIVGIMISVWFNSKRNQPGEVKNTKTVDQPASSTLIQSEKVGDVTIYNNSPTPTPSPSGTPQPTPSPLTKTATASPSLRPVPSSPTRSTASIQQNVGAETASSALTSSESSAHKGDGFDYAGEILLGNSYTSHTYEFSAKYIAPSNKATQSYYFWNNKDKEIPEEKPRGYMMRVAVSGENSEEVEVFTGFKWEFESQNRPCIFTVTGVSSRAISFSFHVGGSLQPSSN